MNKKYHPSYGWLTPRQFRDLQEMPLGTQKEQEKEKIKAENTAAKKKTWPARRG